MDKVSRVSAGQAPVGGDLWCLAIGFSARALAEALRDAGLRVIAVDAFGDKDLKESAKVPQILGMWGAPGVEKTLQTDRWTFYRELPNETATDDPLPVFLAGGCENWPELLDFLAEQPSLKLLGPSPREVVHLRDPLIWQKACLGCDVVFPESQFLDASWTGHGSEYGSAVSPQMNAGHAVSPSGQESAVSPSLDRSWTGHGSVPVARQGRDNETAVSLQGPPATTYNALAHETGVSPSSPGPPQETAVSPELPELPVSPGLLRRWLWKKRSTGGGLGILRSEEVGSPIPTEGYYRQQFVEGRSLGASFLIQNPANSPIDVQLVGITEAWSDSDWPAGSEFIYRGSFGPIDLKPNQQHSAVSLVLRLLQQCDSVADQNADVPPEPNRKWSGWLQVDLIESPDGQLWLLEVNPRWTAGMEVLRLSGQANMAALHALANGVSLPLNNSQPLNFTPQPATQWVGKAIYYAPSLVQLDEQKLKGLHQLSGRGFSDLPSDSMLGSCIESGHPVLTITATIDRKELEKDGLDESTARHEVLKQMHAKRQHVDRLLGVSC